LQPALSPTHQAVEEEEHGSARADPFNLPHSVEQPAARTHTHTLSHSHTLTLTLAHTLSRAQQSRQTREACNKEKNITEDKQCCCTWSFWILQACLEFVPIPVCLVTSRFSRLVLSRGGFESRQLCAQRSESSDCLHWRFVHPPDGNKVCDWDI